MSSFTADDHRCMARALELARRGLNSTRPNPRVGCVLAHAGVVVGEGWHVLAGGPHAEVSALKSAGGVAQGATAYVTLEPCAHSGRTGPCADALIAAGIARAVIAIEDPFPDVAGRGLRRLTDAGITVDTGLMAEEARRLNAGFLQRIVNGRPRVTLKLAVSLDGRTAMQNGESRWITGEPARRDVQRLRAASGAILTGVGTVRTDDPSLTVRDALGNPDAPLRVVLDSHLAMSCRARMLQLAGNTVVYCVDGERRGPLEAAGAEVVRVAATSGRVSLAGVLADLARREVNDLLVEAGPVLAGALLDHNLVDELVIYQSCHIMGSETRGLADTPHWQSLADRRSFRILDRRQVGTDLRITALPIACRS